MHALLSFADLDPLSVESPIEKSRRDVEGGSVRHTAADEGRSLVTRAIRRLLPVVLAASLATAGFWPAGTAHAQTTDPYHEIYLDWNAGGDDDTVGVASYYEMKYSTANPANFSSVDAWWNDGATRSVSGLPTPAPFGTPQSVKVSGLASGTPYYFVIRSSDGWNWSSFSNVASGATLTCDAPTGAPGSFNAQADTGLVDLTWSGSDPKADRIHVYRGTSSSSLSLLTTLSNPSQTSYTDTQVTPGRTYYYQVAWAVACGDGPRSSVDNATPLGTAPPPGAETDAARLHAYPNPSSGSSTVQFVIHVPGNGSQAAQIRLYDLSGRWIATLADGSYSPGDHTVSWNRVGRTGRPVSPGYYEAIGTVGATRVRERLLLTP